MQPSLILFIDDNQTVRKVVEGYLTQAGYRTLLAASAEKGLELALSARPDLILLDHQLPGTTGDQICKQLLEREETASIPVVICSAMRNKAFAQYAEFANVVNQIPKPFTAELLRSGVANALHNGRQVVQAQRAGSAMPESTENPFEPILQGSGSVFALRTVFDFLNNGRHAGRLVVEIGNDKVEFAFSGGRIQAVYAPTIAPSKVAAWLPPEIEDLAPLLEVSLAERHDNQVSGLIRLLEKSLTDPRRLRALLRCQSAVLTYRCLTEDPGPFAFLPASELPPMFQVFPLMISLAALSVEGVRRCDPVQDLALWGGLVFRKPTRHGGNPDRAGLTPLAVRVQGAIDGLRDLNAIASEQEMQLEDLVNLVRGLELAGVVERRADALLVLIVEDDLETIKTIESALRSDRLKCHVKVAHERAGAQLLLRRGRFDIVIMAIDGPEQEQFYGALRAQAPPTTRFVGLVPSPDDETLVHLDAIGLDGIIDRPVTSESVLNTVKLLTETAAVSQTS